MGMCTDFCKWKWYDPRIAIFLMGCAFVAVRIFFKLQIRWCMSSTSLVGKTVIVTGSNTGIGYQIALDFAKRGAKLILACRNPNKANEAQRTIKEQTNNPNVHVALVDFCSLTSVRNFVKVILEKEERLDILVNNAGVWQIFSPDSKTEDDFYVITQVNYLAPFLLTNLLMPLLLKTPGSRIVNTSAFVALISMFSVADLGTYPGKYALYNDSKLCQIYFTMELGRRLKDKKVYAFCYHPGFVLTDIFNVLTGPEKFLFTLWALVMFRSPFEGAQCALHCSLEPGLERQSGEYFTNCGTVFKFMKNTNPELIRPVWDKTVDILGLRKEDLHI